MNPITITLVAILCTCSLVTAVCGFYSGVPLKALASIPFLVAVLPIVLLWRDPVPAAASHRERKRNSGTA